MVASLINGRDAEQKPDLKIHSAEKTSLHHEWWTCKRFQFHHRFLIHRLVPLLVQPKKHSRASASPKGIHSIDSSCELTFELTSTINGLVMRLLLFFQLCELGLVFTLIINSLKSSFLDKSLANLSYACIWLAELKDLLWFPILDLFCKY